MNKAIETQLSAEWTEMQKSGLAARVQEEQAIKTGFLERLNSAKATLMEQDRAARATKPLSERIKETIGVQLSDNWYEIAQVDRAMRASTEHKKNEPVTHLSPVTSVNADQQRRDAERIANGKPIANAVGELALSRDEWVNAQAEKRIDAAGALTPAEVTAPMFREVTAQLDARRDQRLDALVAQVVDPSQSISVKNSVLDVMRASADARAVAGVNPADPLAAVDRPLSVEPRVEPELAEPAMTREALQPSVAVVARAEIVKEAIATFTPEQEAELLSADIVETWSHADATDLQSVRDVPQQTHTEQVMADNAVSTPAYAEALTRVAPEVAQRLASAVEREPEAASKTLEAYAFNREAGKELVEALTSNHRDKAYAKWASLDTTNLNAATDPDQKDQIYSVIVDNTRDPQYKAALSDIDFGLSVRASFSAREEDRRIAEAAPSAVAATISTASAVAASNVIEKADDLAVVLVPAIPVEPRLVASPVAQTVVDTEPSAAVATPVEQDSEKTVAVDAPQAQSSETRAEVLVDTEVSIKSNTPAAATVAEPQKVAVGPRASLEAEENTIEPAVLVRTVDAAQARVRPIVDTPAKPDAEEEMSKRGASARLLEAITRPFRSVGKAGNEMEAPAVMTKTGYSVPDAIQSRYTVQDGDYWRFGSAKDTQSNDHRPAFRDHGPRLATSGDDRSTVADMVSVAQAKGWQSVSLKGTEEFRRAAWLEASLAGIQTKGFDPQTQDRAMLDAARREREALTISRGKAPEPSQTPAAKTTPTQAVAPSVPAEAVPKPEAAPQPLNQAPAAPSATLAAQMAAVLTPQAVPPPAVERADVLVSHGHAPYLNDTENRGSYFVTVRDQAGQEQTSWGVDLERAIAEAKVRPGDAISMENLGAQQVTVQAPIKNEEGKTVGFEEKLARRNIWEVTKEAIESPMQPERAAAPLMDVNALRKQVEAAIAGQPDNVKRAVMDRFAERLQAGLAVQAEHDRTSAPPEQLTPQIVARVEQVDAERIARVTIEHAAAKHEAPRPEVSQQGAPTMTP